MEKILDALSKSIDHPKKSEVIEKLKSEFVSGKEPEVGGGDDEIDELIRGTPNEKAMKQAVDQARVVLFNRLRKVGPCLEFDAKYM